MVFRGFSEYIYVYHNPSCRVGAHLKVYVFKQMRKSFKFMELYKKSFTTFKV